MFTEMTINGVDIQTYNARLQNYSVGGTAVSHNQSTVGTLLKMPSLFSTTLGTRQLTTTLTFKPARLGSDSRNTSVIHKLRTATENIANFEAVIIGKIVEITLPDGFTYTALVTTLSAATFDSSGEHDVTYTFSAIRHGTAETITVQPNGRVYCKSTTSTPFKIVVAVASACDSIEICGITVSNVTENAEIIIDGTDGIITMDGRNKVIDTDLVDFPYLVPGYNTISCSDDNADIEVTYTPIYV